MRQPFALVSMSPAAAATTAGDTGPPQVPRVCGGVYGGRDTRTLAAWNDVVVCVAFDFNRPTPARAATVAGAGAGAVRLVTVGIGVTVVVHLLMLWLEVIAPQRRVLEVDARPDDPEEQ